MEKKKVLCWSDSPTAGTGFGVVSKNVIGALHKSGKYEIHQLAINFHGDFTDDQEVPWQIRPAKVLDPNDPHGIKMFMKVLQKNRYDIVWILNDLFVTHYLNDFIPKYKTACLKQNIKPPKFIYYYPVDCHVQNEVSEALDMVDIPVCYTKHGKQETLKKKPYLESRLVEIPHGVDSETFKPMSEVEIATWKRQYLNVGQDTFVVVAVNRNSTRKQLPYSVLAFKEFKKLVPNSIMYCHTQVVDQGSDMSRVLSDLGLSPQRDVVFPGRYSPSEPAPGFLLNQFYNCGDLFLTTHLGEGWGLCVDSSTILDTYRGGVQIKDILIGDEVIGQDGKFHKVLDKTSRLVDEIFEIKSMYTPNIKVTSEHPFFVLSKDGKKSPEWINVKNININDYLALPKFKEDKPLPDSIDILDYIDNVEYNDNYVWYKMGYSPKTNGLSISDIQNKFGVSKRVAEDARRCYLNTSLPSRGLPGSLAFSISEQLKEESIDVNTQQLKIKRKIPITDEFLYLLGWYLAEGNNGNKARIELDFHVNEMEIAEKLGKYLNDTFSVQSVVEQNGTNKCRIRASGKALASLFGELCGVHSQNKKVPEFLFNSPKKLGKLVLGLFLGDGHFRKKSCTLTTTSPSLAFQMRNICSANNILLSVKEYPPGKLGNYSQYICRVVVSHLDRWTEFTGCKWNFSNKNRKQSTHFIETDDYFFFKVVKISRKSVKDKKVYDICVDNTHSFVANGILAHNTVTEAMAAGVPVVAPNNTCYKPGTNVFLEDRIDSIENIKVGDKVLSINPETKNASYKEVTHVYELDHDGELIVIDTEQIKLSITPDHRVLHSDGRFSDTIIESKAENLTQSMYRLPCYGDMGNWNYDDYFYLPEPDFKQVHKKSQTHDRFHMDDFLSLLGWYISEGSIEKTGYRIRISQSKQENRKEILSLLDRMEINNHLSGDNICFNHNQLWQVFSSLGTTSQTKRLPRWVFTLHREQLVHLFNSMIKGDGHKCDIYTGYVTSSKALVRDFAELCMCMGYTFSIKEKKREDVVIKDRIIPKENQSVSWFIRVNNPKSFVQIRNCQGTQKSRKQDLKRVPYSGKVYCVTVKDNNNLFVGENGHFIFSGNCMPQQLGENSERGYMYECKDWAWIDHSGFRPKGLISDIVDKMLEVYKAGPKKNNPKVKEALSWAREHDWKQVTQKWLDLFERASSDAIQDQIVISEEV